MRNSTKITRINLWIPFVAATIVVAFCILAGTSPAATIICGSLFVAATLVVVSFAY
ncbi:hypothetical protein KKG56_05315 [bacterium]|nr:hypothetical protein [bacterium]